MPNQLSTTEKLSVAVSSCVIATLALLLCLKLKLSPSYSDFIVGNITWRADTKFQDLIAAPVCILVLFFVFLFSSHQLFKQKKQFGYDYSSELSSQLIWWSVPYFSAILSLVLGEKVDQALFIISAVGVGFVLIVSAYNASRLTNISPELIGLSAFSIILMGLIPLEIALVLGRAPTALVGVIDLVLYKKVMYAIVGFGMVVGLLYAMRYPEKLSIIFPKFILIGQVGLSTLFLTLYPARFFLPNGGAGEYQTTWKLKVFIVGIIMAGMFDVVRRYRQYSASAHGNWANLLSPVALFAFLVALRAGNTVSPHISPDDYHFGEIVLGWWSYLHGEIPYVGYFPPHGIIPDDLSAFLSYYFYDGTAGSFSDAGRLGYALLAFATFISIYRFAGSVGLAFISTFFAGSNFSWLFLAPFLCLWFSRSLKTNPARWLSIWMLTVPIVILGVPGQGLLLVAASGVMAANFTWSLWRNTEKIAWMDIGISLTILIVLGIFTPFPNMLFGAIRYVLENGPINQVAYGIPWELSWNTGVKAGFLFETIRMSWVAIPVACLAIIYASMKDQEDRKNVLLPAIVVLLFSLLLISYSMGRIDPGAMSRPGLAAIFGWAILFPLAVWGGVKSVNRPPLILLVAGMSAALNYSPLSFSNFVSAASSQISTGPLKDGHVVGLSNIGKATVQDEHWDRLTRLNALLNSKLAPNESYLDLTSRNAQYFYLNRKPMMAVTAPYNMVSSSQQKRAVKLLSKNLPRLVLLDGVNILHDGGGLALRNPYLYRFIIDNYTPSFEDGFIIGYKKVKGVSHNESTIDVGIKNLTDGNWDRGINRLEPAVIVADPALMPVVAAGDPVRIAISDIRKITKFQGEKNSIWLDGSVIDADVAGFPNRINISVGPQRETEYRVSLFEKAFGQSDFQKIPVAWGRSEKSLEQKMTLIRGVGGLPPSLHDLVSEDGGYKVTGTNPQLVFNISSLGLSGHDAGLLRFDFSCANRSAEPRIHLFWWADDHDGPFESSSIRFTADDGPLIIPLDASPRWLMMKHIKGIRIDLDDATACGVLHVRGIGFFQRHL